MLPVQGCQPLNTICIQVGDKRSRDTNETGGSEEAAIKKFLQDFAALPVDQMDSDQVEEQLCKLKSELKEQAAHNPSLNQILVAAMAAPS